VYIIGLSEICPLALNVKKTAALTLCTNIQIATGVEVIIENF